MSDCGGKQDCQFGGGGGVITLKQKNFIRLICSHMGYMWHQLFPEHCRRTWLSCIVWSNGASMENITYRKHAKGGLLVACQAHAITVLCDFDSRYRVTARPSHAAVVTGKQSN